MQPIKEKPIASDSPAVDSAAAGHTCSRCGLEVSAEAEFCPHCGQRVGRLKKVPWWHVHRRVYDWTLAWAYKPSAAVALFVLSFAESSFFPVPPDVLLMPLALGNPRKWFRYALICSVASVLGACAGFAIGWGAWEAIGWMFFEYVPGFTPDVFQDVSTLYDKYNFWIVFTAGFTPIPFKVITITAGVFSKGVDNPYTFFTVFVIASVISRSARFFLVAGLMRLFGPKITPLIDKYFNLLALLFTAMLIGGFVIIKYVL